MRRWAQKKGFSLSDKGMFKRFTEDGNRLDNLKSCFDCPKEEDIFKALGLDYVPPGNRDALLSSDTVVFGQGGDNWDDDDDEEVDEGFESE